MTMFWEQDGVVKDSSGQTPIGALASFRLRPVEPIEPYACSSVERGMFMAWLEQAIELGRPADKEELLAKAKRMLELTPYTNYSGD